MAEGTKTKPAAKPRAKKADPVMPKLVEVKVSRSYGVKINLGNYESADAHVSQTETFDVTGVDEEVVDKLVDAVKSNLEETLQGELAEQGAFLESLKND